MERFQYNLQRSRHNGLNDETLKIILLRGMRDDFIDILNLMGVGDVSLLKYVEICDLCRRYSRNSSRSRRGIWDIVNKTAKCNTPILTLFALNVYDVYIVINCGVELKAKSPP